MRLTILTLAIVLLALTACAQTEQPDLPDVPAEDVEEDMDDGMMDDGDDMEDDVDGAMDDSEDSMDDTEGAMGDEMSEPKVFVITGENFKFLMDGEEAPELRVKVGDTVRIEFTSTSGFHDWVVDEFNAATEKVRDGESTFVEFVADKAGTFEYYCSVGSHRANGMVGNLVVE